MKVICQGHIGNGWWKTGFLDHTWVLNPEFSPYAELTIIEWSRIDARGGRQPPRWPQGSQPLGIHSLASFPPTLHQAWCLWPVPQGRSDSISLLRLGYKDCALPFGFSSLTFAPGEGSCHVVNNSVRKPTGEGLEPLVNSEAVAKASQQPHEWAWKQILWPWSILEMTACLDNGLNTTSRETLRQKQPFKLLPNSWPEAAVCHHVC